MLHEANRSMGFIVLGRIETKMSGLHAADCVYHRSCRVNFRTGKQVLLNGYRIHLQFQNSF